MSQTPQQPGQPRPPAQGATQQHVPAQPHAAAPQKAAAQQPPRASSARKQSERSFAHQVGETLSAASESISKTRERRRKAAMPPTEPIDIIDPNEEKENEGNESEAKAESLSLSKNPVAFGFLLTVGVGLALALYYVMNNVGSLIAWITCAIFIALGLEPVVNRVQKVFRSRMVSIILVLVVFGALIAGLFAWIIPLVVNQATNFINRAPAMYQEFIESDTFKNLDNQFHIGDWVNSNVPKFFETLTSGSGVNTVMNGLLSAGSTIAQTFTGIIIVLILSLYFLSAMDAIKKWGVKLSPASKRVRVRKILDMITSAVGNYVMGQATVAFINALVAFVAMYFLGVPYAQLLAVIVLILAFIPLVGGVSALVIVSLVLLIASPINVTITYAIVYAIYLQIEAYVVSPRIMSKAVSVPGGVAIIAVAGGGALWGVLGALIGIPVAAACMILLREVFIPYQNKR